MSLIDEALKRARLEAAQKAAEGEGLPYPTIPRHLGPRRRRAWLVPVVVVALAVAAGLVVGLTVASRGGPQADRVAAIGGAEAVAAQPAAADPINPRPAPPPSTTPSPNATGAVVPSPQTAAPVAPAPPAPPEHDRTLGSPAEVAPAAPAPEETAGVPRTAESTTAEPPVAPPAAAQTPPAAADPRISAPEPVAPPSKVVEEGEPAAARATGAPPGEIAPEPAEPTPQPHSPPESVAVADSETGVLLVLPDRSGPAGSRAGTEPAAEAAVETYVQQYRPPEGGAIELGGIAWSESGPFALINGRVVGPGSLIEGYTLDRIRPGHVVLARDDHRIQISLQ